MSAQIIDGKKLAQALEKNLRLVSPQGGLGVVLIGDNPASLIYIKGKQKKAEELKIPFHLLTITEWDDIENLKEKVRNFSNRPDLAGVIIQMPLPGKLQAEELQACVPLEKDVDGLQNCSPFIPATARGVMYALKSTKQLLTGKHAVIIGRSKLVGKPLIDLLLVENCTVTVAHSYTQNLSQITRQADILISATGKAGLIKADMVKEGVIMIDVGITRVADKIVGDTIFDEVKEKASFITPVPGGIGPLTIMFLMANILGQ